MQEENCYFFVEGETEEAQIIKTICVECRERQCPHQGWFWEGSKEGYGPYDFICCECDKVIHKKPSYEENKTAD